MHPIKDATNSKKFKLDFILFQSMHPIKDATIELLLLKMLRLISIHAPYKGCNQAEVQAEKDVISISIHAPYKGCNLS